MPTPMDELHAVAVTIPCADCHAVIGELCRNKRHGGTTIIPHPRRLRDSQEVPF